MQINGTPPKGEYLLAVVDTALLNIEEEENIVASSNPQLSLSPNPADKKVTLTFTAPEPPSRCRITLRSATGQLIHCFSPGDNTCQLHTADLPSGIYFVTLTTPSASCTRKLIKP